MYCVRVKGKTSCFFLFSSYTQCSTESLCDPMCGSFHTLSNSPGLTDWVFCNSVLTVFTQRQNPTGWRLTPTMFCPLQVPVVLWIILAPDPWVSQVWLICANGLWSWGKSSFQFETSCFCVAETKMLDWSSFKERSFYLVCDSRGFSPWRLGLMHSVRTS